MNTDLTPEDIDEMSRDDLDEIQFLSLDGERLTILRGYVERTVIIDGTQQIRGKKLPPLTFQNGVYPPVGQTIDPDVAKELLTHTQYGDRFILQRDLPASDDDTPAGPQIPDGHVMLPDGEVVPLDELQATPDTPRTNGQAESTSADEAGGLTALDDEHVSTKQEAVEALANAGADVSGIASVSNTSKDEILDTAAAAGYYFPTYGDGTYAPAA